MMEHVIQIYDNNTLIKNISPIGKKIYTEKCIIILTDYWDNQAGLKQMETFAI